LNQDWKLEDKDMWEVILVGGRMYVHMCVHTCVPRVHVLRCHFSRAGGVGQGDSKRKTDKKKN
jgi:hypothetical protein